MCDRNKANCYHAEFARVRAENEDLKRQLAEAKCQSEVYREEVMRREAATDVKLAALLDGFEPAEKLPMVGQRVLVRCDPVGLIEAVFNGTELPDSAFSSALDAHMSLRRWWPLPGGAGKESK